MAAVANGDSYIINGPVPHESLPKDTLGVMFKDVMVNSDPNHIFMINSHTGQTLTISQLLRQTCNLAEAFRRYGYNTTTTLGLCSENNLQFFVPVLASMFAGTIVVPIGQKYTPLELEHLLSITEPKVVFCSRKTYTKFLGLKKKMGFIERIVVIDTEDGLEGVENLTEFVNGVDVDPYKFSPFNGDGKKQAAVVLCSSGTTGLPKGVMLSHFNIATRMYQSRDPRYVTKNNVVLGLNPFFHSYGLIFGLSSLFNGHVTVMMDVYQEDFFLKTIRDYKISLLRITPPLAIFLAKTPKLSQYDLSCVKEIFCAAAPLSRGIELLLMERLNLKNIQQAYGLTEATLATTYMKKDVNKPGSCGQVITYMECKVIDVKTGEALQAHHVGELCFRGPTVMLGYFRNQQATRESFTDDGWLRTGDLGYYDEEEYFYIVDRLKEVIKYKGYQVAPAELEAILVNHPKVFEAAVVGIPDEVSGELPAAFVVKKQNVEVTAEEIQSFVASKVSPQKRLRGGVIFTDSIPKNPSGKILRKELRKKVNGFKKQQDSKL